MIALKPMDVSEKKPVAEHGRERTRSAECRLSRWRTTAHAAFILSLSLFLAGTAVSILTAASILEGGVREASLTVSLLLLSLGSSFIGAHALDRIDEILRKL